MIDKGLEDESEIRAQILLQLSASIRLYFEELGCVPESGVSSYNISFLTDSNAKEFHNSDKGYKK